MIDAPPPASPTPPEAMPRSAVSHGAGLAGLAGLAAWLAVAIAHQPRIDGPYAAMAAVAACGLPMILWSLIVGRVHRDPATGIDWTRPRPGQETLAISLTKLAGLWCTWAGIAFAYGIGRWYWQDGYRFAMQMLGMMLPPLIVASIPYVLWLDRRLIEPRDAAWHFGLWLTGRGPLADRGAVGAHVRAWAVKGFFTAFMIAGVPANWVGVVDRPLPDARMDVAAIAGWLIGVMFLIDMAIATVGYLLTLRLLGAHIRSTDPHAGGWTAALICYPPFVLMGPGGALDYHLHGADWTRWLAGHDGLRAIMAGLLVLLTGIYAWATVAFGPRFSNLTNRGILTHGPYRLSKHPAYLAKNLFWWGATLPFLAVGGNWLDSLRNTLLLGVVSGIYYWRARTEERHLMADPAYRAYAAWMAAHGPIPRSLRALRRVAGIRSGRAMAGSPAFPTSPDRPSPDAVQ